MGCKGHVRDGARKEAMSKGGLGEGRVGGVQGRVLAAGGRQNER